MVLMYKSTVVDPPAVIYMGVDKNENEHLIRWGWPEDVWFHVDKVARPYSSILQTFHAKRLQNVASSEYRNRLY